MGAINSNVKNFNIPVLNINKVGKTFLALLQRFKDNITKNLTLSQSVVDDINSGYKYKMQDEFTTKLRDADESRKIIMAYDNNKIVYTIKNERKTLLKNGTIEQAANQITVYYNKYLG